jgi:hypothetical protein
LQQTGTLAGNLYTTSLLHLSAHSRPDWSLLA